MAINYTNIVDMQIALLVERSQNREATLKSCNTQKEKDKWLDRWSQEDAAEKIADAIRSAGRNSRGGIFGIF